MTCECRPTFRQALRCWAEDTITALFFGAEGAHVFRFDAEAEG